MRLGVINGPGHHGPLLLAQLTAHHQMLYTSAYPHFAVLDESRRAIARKRDRLLHDAIRRGTASAQYRLRRWLQHSYDFDLYTRLYAKLAASYCDDTEAVIGFSLVCYDAHKRAKELGHPTVLELPSTHLEAHTEMVAQEYQRANQSPAREGVVFSRFAIERVRQEYVQADIINVLSSFAKQTLVQRGLPPEKIMVTPLGIDVDLFHPRPPEVAKRPFRVLFVGRLELVKGVRYLLEAFGQLQLPEAELWLVGTSFAEARPYLSTYPKGVTLHPQMPQAQLAECYRQADVLVFPTLSDGMGLVMLEAMASGLPVIATDHSGAPEILREGVDGFIVPIRNAERLAQKILWLYQNPEARLVMGQNARARVETMFTQAHYGERLENGMIPAIRRLLL
jgi:glycosyltransferase involved in cell wall biosynthesis